MSIAAPFLALPVTALVVWALLQSTRAAGRLQAAPSADRWHSATTPTFGGVGIFAGLAAAVGAALAFGGIASTGEVGAILAGCALLFAAGLVDDIRALNPLAKLAVQVLAAALVLSSGISVEVVDNEALGWALLTPPILLMADRQSRDYRASGLARLVVLMPLELFFYRPVLSWARAKGTWRYLRGDKEWHKFERNQRPSPT